MQLHRTQDYVPGVFILHALHSGTQDFTAVFAAGNEGFHVSAANDGLKTVTSPATSKNCIAAGATNTAWQLSGSAASSQAYVVLRMAISQALAGGSQVVDNYRVRALAMPLHYTCSPVTLAAWQVPQSVLCEGTEHGRPLPCLAVMSSYSSCCQRCAQVMQASFGRPMSALFGRQYALSVTAPADGCSALSNAAAVAGTVVLVLRGTCTFAVKVQHRPFNEFESCSGPQ